MQPDAVEHPGMFGRPYLTVYWDKYFSGIPSMVVWVLRPYISFIDGLSERVGWTEIELQPLANSEQTDELGSCIPYGQETTNDVTDIMSAQTTICHLRIYGR